MHAHGALEAAASKRPRLDIAQVFRASGGAFRKSHALDRQQLKAMRAIESCRTAVLGGHADVCEACGHVSVSYNSCRNRHCPKCQSLAQARWIEQRRERILPVRYFHVVFTLPAALRPLARRNPKRIFGILFDAAAQTLLELGRDEKRLGGTLGVTEVLHTWTRALQFHPHVHCIVTAGGLSADGTRWVRPKGKDRYLFPVLVLSRLFRGKFLARLSRAFAAGEIHLDPDPDADRRAFAALKAKLLAHDWVVYAKRPFKGAEHLYQYLGRYTHRVGISNQRLRAIDDATVTFHTKLGRTETLSHEEFIRRFLLHVLPSGFVKIRHFGLFASGNVATKLQTARALLAAEGAPLPQPAPKDESWEDFVARLTGEDPRVCPRCGGRTVRLDLDDLGPDLQPLMPLSSRVEPDT